MSDENPQSGRLARLFAECVAAVERSEESQLEGRATHSVELVITPQMRAEAWRRIERAGVKR